MDKKTKIIATISPFHCDVDFIRQLWENGMNVVRLNTAHADAEGMERIINNVRAVSNEIAILIDTKGPEVRTTILKNVENAGTIHISVNDEIRIYGKPEQVSEAGKICVSYVNFYNDISVGTHVLIDDGEIDLLVTAKDEDDRALVCIAQNDGELGSRKSVNVPGVSIKLPSVTEKDRRNVIFAIEHELDFIAHSFVRSKEDVLDIQRILDMYDSKIKIISKIENQEGINNIDEIVEASYGIMIARGDLGIEIPQEKIPGIQRILIRKCVTAKKPVIVATQMLQSMIENPRPTRAEVTDIANAIFYRTDALMLSGETAKGKYAVEAVRTMSKIAAESEKTKLKDNDIQIPYRIEDNDVASFLAKQAVESVEMLGVKALITDSLSGRTARYLAAYRGDSPVLSICYSEPLIRQLALSYGVTSFYQKKEEGEDTRQYFLEALRMLINNGILHMTDKVAYMGGSMVGSKGGATFLEINSIDKIFATQKQYLLPNFE